MPIIQIVQEVVVFEGVAEAQEAAGADVCGGWVRVVVAQTHLLRYHSPRPQHRVHTILLVVAAAELATAVFEILLVVGVLLFGGRLIKLL